MEYGSRPYGVYDVHKILGYYPVKTNRWEHKCNASNRQGPKRFRNDLQAPLRQTEHRSFYRWLTRPQHKYIYIFNGRESNLLSIKHWQIQYRIQHRNLPRKTGLPLRCKARTARRKTDPSSNKRRLRMKLDSTISWISWVTPNKTNRTTYP